MLEHIIQGAITLPEFDRNLISIGPIAGFGPFALRWYALSYIAGIIGAWWLVSRLVERPGAPMARRHVDDFVTWATLGVILGGRLAYVLFYDLPTYQAEPARIFAVWEGGMAYHGGVIGMLVAIILFSRANKLNWLRVNDYIAVGVPIGSFFGRIANFINGELYGRAASVPWAMIFPHDPLHIPRHPSQLYQSGMEGALLFVILVWLFYRTDARLKPGFLTGSFLVGYACFRIIAEFFREPDAQIGFLRFGVTMGQLLSLPMLVVGLYLVLTASARRARLAA